MVREGKDVYYRSVHLFIERVKDSILTKGEELVRTNLNTCLRGTALIWYTQGCQVSDFILDGLFFLSTLCLVRQTLQEAYFLLPD